MYIDFDNGDGESDEGEDIMADGCGASGHDYHSFAEDNGAPISEEDASWYYEQYERWEGDRDEEQEEPSSEGGEDNVDTWRPADNFNKSVAVCVDVFFGCKDKLTAVPAAMDLANALWIQEEKDYSRLVKRIRKMFVQAHPDKNPGRVECNALFDALHTVMHRVKILKDE